MIRGAHTAMSAMQSMLARQEVLAQNLSNHSSPGYKQETGAVDGFAATLGRAEAGVARSRAAMFAATPTIGNLGVETAIDRVSVDFRQGNIEETGHRLDLALKGDGFLEARTADGDLYFRGGALQLDAAMRLVTSEGFPVLGADGEEVVLREGELTIGTDGTINVDGEPAGVLSVVEFAPGTLLAKVGDQAYAPDDPDSTVPMVAVDTQVMQGFLESSNVDPIATMAELVSVVRAYQASQRMLQAQDELLGKAVNEVGRV